MYSFFGVGTRLRTGEVNPLFGFENVIEAGLVGAGSNVKRNNGRKERQMSI